MNMINDIFGITNFLDSARWEKNDNYNLINFYHDTLPNDSKILTHWLCYITDRQMPFKRIWDIGGFVFSELVDTIKKSRDLNVLNPKYPDKSFFIKRMDYCSKHNFKKQDYEKYLFVSHQKVGQNKILLENSDFEENDDPYFISRYYPSDYVSILNTLYILKNYDFSLTKYIICLLNKIPSDKPLIPRLLYGLFLLSYYDIGQPKYSELNFEKNLLDAEGRTKKVEEILSNNFEDKFSSFKEDQIFYQKRAWCSLRDYLKSPEFNKYFTEALKENSFESACMSSLNQFNQLELPGDVWNNNPKFRKCILRKTKYEKNDKLFSKVLREIYTNEHIENGYPEQFDITFDFIPRMCEVNNCLICPYGVITKEAKEFKKICINDKNKYCAVVLICCNYKMMCKGNNCSLLGIINKYSRDS